MGKKNLFDEDDDRGEGELKINQSYAQRYTEWREKEEQQKLIDKYGQTAALQMMADRESDESSSSEEEDDEGDGWDSDLEKEFFQTLSVLKKKDPTIYESGKKFFSKGVRPMVKTAKEESLTLRDYERKTMLEKDGKFSDDEETPQKTYNEEQEELKQGFKDLLKDSDDEGDLLKVRKKTDAEKQKEEEEYKEWLKGNKEDISSTDTKAILAPLKEYWTNPHLDENEKFLRDFFLNKRYKSEENPGHIPSYDEIVHDSDDDLSADEKTVEKQTEFEHKYNFRFEEPDQEFIKRYPRTIANSLRRPDTKRKEKREEVRDRKLREKEEKKEEMKMLKQLKLKEIQKKLEHLKAITGNDTLPFQHEDLEADFDPDQYDKQMGQLFNQNYYHGDEEEKPEFPYDPEIDDENWDEYGVDPESYVEGNDGQGPSTSTANYDNYRGNDDETPSTSKANNDTYYDEGQDDGGYNEGGDEEYDDGPHCEDPDFNMDCDYDPDIKKRTRDELIESTSTRRKRKIKKSIFAQKLEAKKPAFDPEKYPNFGEYLEEYYKLDFEDIIGGQPVRYRYRSVVPNDYGLDTEEILCATDKELNKWVSVKKMVQYRSEHEEKGDLISYQRRKKQLDFKKRYLPSLYSGIPQQLIIEEQERARKKRRRKEGKPEDPEPQQDINDAEEEVDQEVTEDLEPKKKKRKNKDKDPPYNGGQNFENSGSYEQSNEYQQETTEEAVPKKKRKNKDKDPPYVNEHSHETAKPNADGLHQKKQFDDTQQKEKQKGNPSESGRNESMEVTGTEESSRKEKKKKLKDQNMSQTSEEGKTVNIAGTSHKEVSPGTQGQSPRKNATSQENASTAKNETRGTNLTAKGNPRIRNKKKETVKRKAKMKKKRLQALQNPQKKEAPVQPKRSHTETGPYGFDVSFNRLKLYGIKNPAYFCLQKAQQDKGKHKFFD